MRNEKGQFVKGHPIFPNNPFRKGNKIGPRFPKGYNPWNKGLKGWRSIKDIKRIGKITSEKLKGQKLSEKHKRKLSQNKLGKYKEQESWNWKGDKVKYHGLHRWVPKHLGKPTKCEHCKKDGLTGKLIHWANKSGEYKRDLNDWLRLCAKCHKKYDSKK